MERIYFDKQIFSYLFKGNNALYENFLSNLYNNKHNFLYCYSHAHLLDLKNDNTDIKYKELEFIETLVEDNYLSYHHIDKKTSCYLAKPTEAFNHIEDDYKFSISNTFSELFDDFDLSFATPEQQEMFFKAKGILTNQKIDFGFSQFQDLPKEITSPLSKILPLENYSMTLMEWTEHFMRMLQSMEADKTVYKSLRNIIDKHINNGKFTVEYNNIDFDDNLKNSALQKSFTDFVTSNLNPHGDKNISDYDFFTHAYFTLDLLGISKEPSKSVKFINVINDGYHSYYGAFCDYVVSDDQGFLKKTKAMYRLLNIQTKVLHINEFIPYFNILSNNFEKNTNIFFDLLFNDLKNGLVIDSKNSMQYDRQTTTIKPNAIYLGYFNKIDLIKKYNQDYIFLSRTTNNYSYFSFYREYEGVINKAVNLFGIDSDFKGEFNWYNETKEIQEGNWAGRYWELENLTILIEVNKGTRELCLLITIK